MAKMPRVLSRFATNLGRNIRTRPQRPQSLQAEIHRLKSMAESNYGKQIPFNYFLVAGLSLTLVDV